MNGQQRTHGTDGARITIGLATALCAISWNASAGEHAGQKWHRVNVDLSSQVQVPPALLRDGQEAATNIFAGIHVQLLWTGKRQSSEAVEGCADEAATHHLVVEIVPHAPARFSNVALAMAMPYADSGVRIVIFYDRVDPLLRGHHAPEARILVTSWPTRLHMFCRVLRSIPRRESCGHAGRRMTSNRWVSER